jgi:hypothetical protein
VQLCYGHLHGRDDIPSGITQRTVKVKNYQPFAHLNFIILLKFICKVTHNSPYFRIFAPTFRIVYEELYDREREDAGDNVTIGAGPVVVKDIPSNTVAVGNPCKVIKNLSWRWPR